MPPASRELVAVTDSLVEGVHFPVGSPPASIGHRAFAVNLSDIAAMGAEAAWALLALTMPDSDDQWLEQFARAAGDLCRRHGVSLVGGDTTRGPLSITVTIHGFVAEGAAILRSGARVGDAVYVTGTLGDAAAGLRCLDTNDSEANRLLTAPPGARASLIERLNRPMPRVAQGLALRGRATAGIDVSDGLLADLGHICTASGVGAEIDVDALPSSSALLALFDGEARRTFQLGGGDDYELCFTANETSAANLLGDLARSGCAATRVGRIVAEPGVRIYDGAGQAVTLPHAGWEHFA